MVWGRDLFRNSESPLSSNDGHDGEISLVSFRWSIMRLIQSDHFEALLKCIERNDAEGARWVLQAGRADDVVRAEDAFGLTALHFAVSDYVQTLLQTS